MFLRLQDLRSVKSLKNKMRGGVADFALSASFSRHFDLSC